MYKAAMVKEVSRKSRLLRRAGVAVIVLMACYAVILLVVQVNERVTRRRAERLLSEMRSLEVGKSSWADLQTLMMRWGAWGHYEGDCAAKKCNYSIAVSDMEDGSLPMRILGFLGNSHMAWSGLEVLVQDGTVNRTSFNVGVYVPKGYGPRWERNNPQPEGYIPYSSGSHELIARATSHTPIMLLCCYWPGRTPNEYTVLKPSGCMGCLAIWTEISPEASITSRERMMNFNLSCITRWKPCIDEEDIMPDAGKEYYAQLPVRHAAMDRLERCAFTVSELAEASINAAVVRLGSFHRDTASFTSAFEAQLISRLGGPTNWKPSTVRSLDTSGIYVDREPVAKAIAENQPLIVLFPSDGEDSVVHAYPCGLIPYTEQDAKLVQAAVALGKGHGLDD